MLSMEIERFRDRDAAAIYQRLREKGRKMPDGHTYLDSWIEPSFDRVFQLMECDDLTLFQEWIVKWRELMEFEVVPAVPSRDTIRTITPFLNDGRRSDP